MSHDIGTADPQNEDPLLSLFQRPSQIRYPLGPIAAGATDGPAARQHNSNIKILRSISGFALMFVIFGGLVDPPAAIVAGLAKIIMSRDTLVTDYVGIGGLGAAMVNAGLLTLIVCFIYERCAVKIGGASVACLFLILGFGLFGKNLLNIWCVVLGVWLYSRFRRESFAAYIDLAFFGTALGPIFSEILFSTSLSISISIPLSVATSLAMGFVLAPVAAHLFKAHMGLSLYNIGFASGITATIVVALYKSYGFVPEPAFIWTSGNNLALAAILAVMFLSMIGLGLIFDRSALRKQTQILAQSGQAPTDFISLFGIGPTFLNMGFTGVIGSAYVLLINSDLNGPTIGAILTIVGFSAFGKHPGNILPIMAGVFVGSLAKQRSISNPTDVLAALLGTSLAPIAGRFGWRWGIVAGFLHSSVIRSVGQLHGGLVLYNNGFSAGLVAAVLVPIILAFGKRASTNWSISFSEL